jgi:hypothetical protein
LGHVVSAEGMKPDPMKVAVVRDWPLPESFYDVRSFLGLANYFRKYIRGYAGMAVPLTNLLKGLDKQDRKGKLMRWQKLSPANKERVKQEFAVRWTPACTTAFDAIKQALCSAPVLALPNFEKAFELIADACEHPSAVGAVLIQEGHPVTFYSRKLSGPELNYSASDIEMLAVILALKEWRCYLEGGSFIIVTDHKQNTYLSESTNIHTTKRRARWLEISCAFDYTWQYRPGRIHVATADTISSAPQHFSTPCGLIYALAQEKVQGLPCACSICCAIYSLRPRPMRVSVPGDASVHVRHPGDSKASTRWAESREGSDIPAPFEDGSTRQCESVSHLDQLVDTPKNSLTAHHDIIRAHNEAVMGRMQVDSFYSRLCEGYSAAPFVSQGFQVSEPDENGIRWTLSKQIFIPDHGELRDDCIEAVHAPTFAGHFGIIRTIKKLKEVYFWPNMRKDVERFVKSCDSCQKVKASKQKKVGPLQPLQIPGRRWESISMDLITDLPPSVNQNDSILVVVDRLSKMCHLEACTKTITSAGVAEIIESRVFRYHGMPLSIVSDRDVRFTSQVWEELHARLGIQLRRSTPQHPQTDGQTENANGVLEDTLRHFVGPFQNNWEELLPVAEFAMNNAWNTTIQNTPFMLNFGQNPDTPVIASLRSRNSTVNQFVGRWSEQLSKARDCIQVAQQRQKQYADRHRRAAPIFKPGDEVLLSIKQLRLRGGFKAKLAPRYVGPFKVLSNIGPNNLAYRISLPSHLSRMHNVFHVSALKPYLRSMEYQPPPLPELIDGELEWEVDWIEATRYEGSRRQYLVHWTGYSEPQWESVSHLINCPEKLKEFWRFKQMMCPHPIKDS